MVEATSSHPYGFSQSNSLIIKVRNQPKKNSFLYITKGTIFKDMLGGDCDGDSDVSVDDRTGDYDDEDHDGDYEDDEDIEDENVDGLAPNFSGSINNKVILSNFHDWSRSGWWQKRQQMLQAMYTPSTNGYAAN